METPSLTKWLAVVVLLVSLVSFSHGSRGDQSKVHRMCLFNCTRETCVKGSLNLEKFHSNQPVFERWLGWDCFGECNYQCMWKTIQRLGVVYQFHGKWPFARILGVQEPASALFSIFNLVAHLVMTVKLWRSVVSSSSSLSLLEALSAPTLKCWLTYALVSINAWTWSTVFHTRDVDWTEKADYLCAYSIVLFQLLAFFQRLTCHDRSWIRSVGSTAVAVAAYSHHVHNMINIKFDYGYNMKVNIFVGLLQSILWLSWSYKNRRRLPHVKWIAGSVLAMDVTILLEVLEFEPILWTFDSHALWHLSTSPIHLATYTFAIEDIKFLVQEKELSEKQKLP